MSTHGRTATAGATARAELRSSPAARARAWTGATVTAAVAGLAACAAVVTAHALARPLDHDEHQFVASAALLVRDGLLPYRDYPYHHLPYLTFAYAALFAVSDHLLVAARTFSAAFAVGCIALVFAAVHGAFRASGPLARFAVAAGFALALALNPLFQYTAGAAWNHDVSVFFALAAFLLMHRAAHAARPSASLMAAGAALGIAVGVRSSFALLVPGFAIGVLWMPQGARGSRALARCVAFGAGFAFALAPVLPLFLESPSGFLHGNLRYNVDLNPAYRRLHGYEIAMSLEGKVRYLLSDVLVRKRNAAVVLAAAAAYACIAFRGRRRWAFETRLAAVLLPFSLLAAFSATPSWAQYFYPVVPLLLLGTAYALADARAMRWRTAAVASAGAMLAVSVTGVTDYARALEIEPSRWTALCVHRVGARVADLSGGGRVFTLGPIFALEGGAASYPAMATGPFSWRTTPLVASEERAASALVGPDEFARVLTEWPASGILTGIEMDEDEGLEKPLVAYAREHGWEAVALADDLTMWVPDAPAGTVTSKDDDCGFREN